MVVFFAITKALQPRYGAPELQGFAISVLPIAFAAVAQAIVVISGGIDLSVGSMMALASVVSAVLMKGQSDLTALVIVIATLGLGIVLGVVNGGLIVVTRVPDIVVTLAMSFVWAGTALLVLHTPGGGAAKWLMDLISGALRHRVAAAGRSSSSSSSSRSSGSRSAARRSACRSTRSAATGWRPSGAASPSAGRSCSPTR